jgi:hypothetical protein
MKLHIGTLIACVVPAAMPGAGMAATPIPPQVPESLKAAHGEVLTFVAQAAGVQIYECRAVKDKPAHFEWVLKGPEAELFDGGRIIGRHYTGPTWEANDGSKVVGQIKARANGPDSSAIPWLLLTAKSNSGDGVFGRTRSIQRIHTVGGLAPTAACRPEQAGQETHVNYEAAYYFYAAP